MTTTVIDDLFGGRCQWCSQYHSGGMCPQIKSIEYYENGEVKRVEFWGLIAYDGVKFTSVGGTVTLTEAEILKPKSTKGTCDICDAPIEFNEQYGVWMHLRSGVNHTASPKEEVPYGGNQ